MISEVTGGRVPIRLWTDVTTVEPAALAQLRNVASLPWVFHHVAVMADCHHGIGATIGSVIAMKGAISPACVGVDLGCGMVAARTNLRASDLPDDLRAMRSAIEAAIPVGFNSHDEGAFGDDIAVYDLLQRFEQLDAGVYDLRGRVIRQMGTLGGGNHFIEVCLDTDDRVWLMLHSGSRNIGKVLAEIHIGVAKTLAQNADLPDPDLAVFLAGTDEMANYRRDLFWCQEYARLNRVTMMRLLRDAASASLGRAVSIDDEVWCHHNYIAEERHFGEDVLVTRKGAIRAGAGERGIIPGSMGTSSYIVTGLGSPDSFESASHGAGRRMSRGAAKKQFTVADLAAQTSGVECRRDAGVLDEIPQAYKDIDAVMANQRDLVRIDVKLKQILCVKG